MDDNTVLERRTNKEQKGDFVLCTNCGRTMLVNLGSDNCPECEQESLQWADEENQECDEDDIQNLGLLLVDCE